MKKKNKGRNFETKVKNTLNSGALWFDKGDLKTDDHCIECKFTELKGYRITTKLLNKLWDESLSANKMPALIIGIKDNSGDVPVLWTLQIKIEKEVR